MENNLQLQSVSSDGNVLSESMKNLDLQCNNGCYRKIKLLLQNALQDKSLRENHIKELEIKLAKLEVNVSTYVDKIKDKDELIEAFKMTIAFCKNNSYNGNNNNNNNNNESSSRLAALNAMLRDKDNQLAQLQSQLKESENKSVHFFNRMQQLDAMLRSTQSPDHPLQQQIAFRNRDIQELRNMIESKNAQIVLLELEASNHTKGDSKTLIDVKIAELKEKVELLAKQEDIIKDQSNSIANLQAEIEQKNEKLQEVEKLLAMCKAQLKEKNDRQAEKLLKDANIKINSHTNTIKQLKQNITDLQTGATALKAENAAQQETITQLTDKLNKNEQKLANCKANSKTKIESPKEEKFISHPEVEELIASGWQLIQARHIEYSSCAFMLEFQAQFTGYNYKNIHIWLGLENLHTITNHRRHELYVHVVDFDNKTCYARYDNFVVDSGRQKFQLKSLGKYTGDAGDGMRKNENREFSMMQRGTNKSNHLLSFWWHAKPEEFDSSCDLSAIKIPGYRTNIWWMGDLRKSVTMFIKAFEN